MKTHLVAIGNSRGIRIPATILKQAGLKDELDLRVRGSQVIIRSAHRPRSSWEQACAEMAARGDDQLLDPETPTAWDRSEWKW